MAKLNALPNLRALGLSVGWRSHSYAGAGVDAFRWKVSFVGDDIPGALGHAKEHGGAVLEVVESRLLCAPLGFGEPANDPESLGREADPFAARRRHGGFGGRDPQRPRSSSPSAAARGSRARSGSRSATGSRAPRAADDDAAGASDGFDEARDDSGRGATAPIAERERRRARRRARGAGARAVAAAVGASDRRGARRGA